MKAPPFTVTGFMPASSIPDGSYGIVLGRGGCTATVALEWPSGCRIGRDRAGQCWSALGAATAKLTCWWPAGRRRSSATTGGGVVAYGVARPRGVAGVGVSAAQCAPMPAARSPPARLGHDGALPALSKVTPATAGRQRPAPGLRRFGRRCDRPLEAVCSCCATPSRYRARNFHSPVSLRCPVEHAVASSSVPAPGSPPLRKYPSPPSSADIRRIGQRIGGCGSSPAYATT